jgi:titin
LYNGGEDVTGYMVEKRISGRRAWVTVKSKIEATEFVVKGLKEGEECFFRVSAENIFGFSEPLARPKPVVPKTTLNAPDAPVGVDIWTVEKDNVELTWLKPKVDGGSNVTGYFVERCDDSKKWVRANKVACKKTSYRVQNLIEHATYSFRVIAVNAIGESQPSKVTEKVVCKDAVDTPPQPGEIVVDHVGKNSISLTWTRPQLTSSQTVTGYIVESRQVGLV